MDASDRTIAAGLVATVASVAGAAASLNHWYKPFADMPAWRKVGLTAVAAAAVCIVVLVSYYRAKMARRSTFPRSPSAHSEASRPFVVRIARNVREGGLNLVTLSWRVDAPFDRLYLVTTGALVVHAPLRIETVSRTGNVREEWVDDPRWLPMGSSRATLCVASPLPDAARVRVEFVTPQTTEVLTNAHLAYIADDDDRATMTHVPMPAAIVYA